MTAERFIVSDQLIYEEDSAWQDLWKDINGMRTFDRMVKIDPNIKPWEEEYQYSRQINEFEASDNLIISTKFIEPSNTVHRIIAEGDFDYSRNNTLEGGSINNYHIFIKGVDGINLYSETHLSFDDPVPIIAADWEFIYQQITEGDFFNGGKISKTLQPVNPSIKARYAFDDWEQDLFGNDFITNAKADVRDSERSETFNLGAKAKYKKRLADRITGFNPSTDNLEIDFDIFGIDSSATFAAGQNKKAVKKLAKQDFDFLYDRKKGGLYFNENGADKGFGDGGIIAILKGAPDLTASNLEFI